MIITETPLRISFGGGGTDFREYYRRRRGFVVSTAIDKYVYVIVKERFDDRIYLSYGRRKEIVDAVADIQHELIREAMLTTGVEKGIEVSMLADVPAEGSGLGSSSSVTVGLLNAFHHYRGEQVSADVLAREACEIEIDRCGKPIGKQDQYIAACGGLCALQFCPQDTVTVERLCLGEPELLRLSESLLLFYTNVTRSSSEILRRQTDDIDRHLEELDGIRERALRMRECLREGDIEAVGGLMHESWELKKLLADAISNGPINEMYARARQAGALGGKIAGAGGGGFMLLVVAPQYKERVRCALRPARELPIRLERGGSRVIFNHRRGV